MRRKMAAGAVKYKSNQSWKSVLGLSKVNCQDLLCQDVIYQLFITFDHLIILKKRWTPHQYHVCICSHWYQLCKCCFCQIVWIVEEKNQGNKEKKWVEDRRCTFFTGFTLSFLTSSMMRRWVEEERVSPLRWKENCAPEGWDGCFKSHSRSRGQRQGHCSEAKPISLRGLIPGAGPAPIRDAGDGMSWR